MKRSVILIIFGLLFLSTVMSYENNIIEFKGIRILTRSFGINNNNYFEEDLKLIFDDFEGVFLLGKKDDYISLTKEDIKMLKSVIEKYYEWEKIAILNKVKIQKDIPGSNIKTVEFQNKTSRGEYSKKPISIKIIFFSQNELEHQLVIDLAENEKYYIGLFNSPLYINKGEVDKLYTSIADEKIEKIYSDYKNSLEKLKLFN